MPKHKPTNNPDIFVEQSFKEAERKSNIDLLASYYWERYIALTDAGFTTSEAMEIIKARGLNI